MNEKNTTTTTKKSTVRFGFLSAKRWIIWAVALVLVVLAEMGLFWLAKTRMYFHSAGVLFLLTIGVGIMTIVTCVLHAFENDDLRYEHKWDDKKHLGEQKSILAIVSIVLVIILAAGSILGPWFSSSMFNARAFYNTVKENVTVITDNEEISAFPNLLGEKNDTSNLPLIGIPEAIKKAETEMGRYPALGSQFELIEEDMTSQSINGELCYVIPLQPKSIFKWSEEGNHGYFIIDRNNGKTTFVETSLHATTEAPFGDNAKRIINNYLNDMGIEGLVTDISPEVDDENNFHYVATVYTVKGISGFRTVKGIVELDAVTRECKFYNLDEIPEYVDRVYPESFFEDYVKYYGAFKNGFWNTLFGQKEVLEATADMDVIYIDGICYYYTGFTSTGKGESSNGIMMMNSRTGEIEYHITYGIAENKAQGIAEGLVQEKGYIASYPLLIKVAGEETYFMLMRDANENLVGYSFVNYKDYTKAAVATTLIEAQSKYIKSLANSNNSSVLDESMTATVKGTITAITSEVVDGTTIYYVKVEGSNIIFQLYSKLNLEIVFAEVGDTIEIGYYDSGNSVESAISCVLE